ncbi:hypothetical protein QWT87_16375 [Chryseobacterium sp. APV1]|uniref:Uncharacterized protein n=1 Tax=Chryseobacterium urinae TaxID=3058400 RepID=A0ABT8U9Z4_9FLAO|nr:hypothetical protein [Chryseobacterium sp. APV1]MDO3426458.1 hypothetical protein [Chryseobacterium sp. APV1]
MKIIKRRIRNAESYLATIRNGENFHIAFTDINAQLQRVNQIGFTTSLTEGEAILPEGIGPISRFNANGKFNIRRDLEKEPFYIERVWTWTDWGGNTHSRIVSIRRLRYPRELITPPSEELLIDSYNGNKIIVSRQLTKTPENFEDIKHIMNLFLEYFGEFDLIREDYQPFVAENITRLNWKIFPQGEYPWERVRVVANERIQRQSIGNRPIIENHLEKISAFIPNFVAVGQGGFSDYVVFGFPDRNLYIFESVRSGNATYIFNNNWVDLSRLTKGEILSNNLQQERILHTPTWEQRINQVLG